MRLVRYADAPELRSRRYRELVLPSFPEYMQHNQPAGRYWSQLYQRFPEFQLALVDGDGLLAEAHAVPVAWDGTPGDLPAGWDEAFVRGMASDRAPTALCALAISVHPAQRGRGFSERMIGSFRDRARAAGFTAVIAPVRPTLKERYPLIAIERYVRWRRPDGMHFDPWIRVHERVGGVILAPAPRSMVMRAPAADWEAWTGLHFPEDGDYVFPGALATLSVRDGIGTHVEPNVWMRHSV